MSDYAQRQAYWQQRKQAVFDALAKIPHTEITDGSVMHADMIERALWNLSKNQRKYFSAISQNASDKEVEEWLEGCRLSAHIDHTFYLRAKSIYAGWLKINANDTGATVVDLWQTLICYHPEFYVVSEEQDFLLYFRADEHEYWAYLVKMDDSLPPKTFNPLRSFGWEPTPVTISTNSTCKIVLHEEPVVLEDLARSEMPFDPQFLAFHATGDGALAAYWFEARDPDGLLVMQPLLAGKVVAWVERPGFDPPPRKPFDAAYPLLKNLLRKAGWQWTGQYGEKWWQDSFLRESSES